LVRKSRRAARSRGCKAIRQRDFPIVIGERGAADGRPVTLQPFHKAIARSVAPGRCWAGAEARPAGKRPRLAMHGRAGVRRDRIPIPKVPMPAARWFGSSWNVRTRPREGWQRRQPPRIISAHAYSAGVSRGAAPDRFTPRVGRNTRAAKRSMSVSRTIELIAATESNCVCPR
jgi:hypothetical protein